MTNSRWLHATGIAQRYFLLFDLDRFVFKERHDVKAKKDDRKDWRDHGVCNGWVTNFMPTLIHKLSRR